MKYFSHNRGFSVTELIISIAIASLVTLAITAFARNIIVLSNTSQSKMTITLESRKILSVMVAELRSVIPSAVGSYPLESVSTSTIVFYADVNGDDIADRVRYFFEPATNSLRRGVVVAAGNPPAYNLGAESLSTLVSDVVAGTSTPIFEYYDGNYSGTSAPLSSPVEISNVRLVKIIINVEKDPARGLEATLTSQVALRNLKDNI